LLTLKPVIIHGFMHHTAVLLLHKVIVVFAVGAAPGELDVVQVAPVFELVVDKLATVVAVNTHEGKGKLVPKLLYPLLDPAIGAVEEGVFLGPDGAQHRYP
jgi:hypothetical protein